MFSFQRWCSEYWSNEILYTSLQNTVQVTCRYVCLDNVSLINLYLLRIFCDWNYSQWKLRNRSRYIKCWPASATHLYLTLSETWSERTFGIDWRCSATHIIVWAAWHCFIVSVGKWCGTGATRSSWIFPKFSEVAQWKTNENSPKGYICCFRCYEWRCWDRPPVPWRHAD